MLQVDLDIYTPVCLAKSSDTDTFYGKSAWVYGWGTTASGGSASATLLEVFRIFYSEKDEHSIGECPGGDPWPVRSDNGEQGGGPDLRRGRGGQGQLPGEQGVRVATLTSFLIIYHQGDSGGPLTYEAGDQHILIGDVSFGSGCAGV